MVRPFENVVVLDLTHVIAGPFATHQLAMLGADVVKIELPDRPDCARARGPAPGLNTKGLGLTYQVQGTGKRSIAVDLRSEAGGAVFLRLVERADVLVSNYRAGLLDGLGLSLDRLRCANHRLVTCCIAGFRPGSSRAGQGAYDNVIQAASGIVSQSGGRKPGLSFVDYAAGWAAAFAVSAALFQRERTGTAQHVDCAMLDAALMMMGPEMAAALHTAETGSPPPRRSEPGLLAYDTKEGTLMLGAFTPAQMRTLFRALAAEGHDPAPDGSIDDFEALWSSGPGIERRLRPIFLERTASEWEAWLVRHDLPGARVRTLLEAATDPDLRDGGLLSSSPGSGGPLLPTAPFVFEHGGPEIGRPAPALGEHTDEILRGVGYAPAEIEGLRRSGAVA